jgi:myo-inositol-1(or 4)-monophosphatase
MTEAGEEEGSGNALPPLTDDFALLAAAVRSAGATALGYFNRDTPVYRKRDGSEVTDADLAVDAELRAALVGERPGYGWLSEESADDPARLDARRVWIVDPIDGTRAFVLDKQQWVISVALVEGGQPVAAAIYNPSRDEMFTACLGEGAQFNGTTIEVSRHDALHGAHILTPASVAKRAGWSGPGAPDVETSFVYSIAYRLALVAAGRADGLISLGRKNEWDVAAGTLIVQEAGGLVTTTAGVDYAFNKPAPVCDGTVAAPERLHGALVLALRRLAGTSD